jgi:endonuclease-3
MQYRFPFEAGKLASQIDRRMRAKNGALPDFAEMDPVSQLVASLIGSRTRGEVSLAVFHSLQRQFRNWEAIFGISDAALSRRLSPVTFAERKAVQLRSALSIIKDQRGSLRLDFLTGWPVEYAQAWLQKLPGVGLKVSSAVLNFSTLRMRALVVDCHHFRVAKRLGLLDRRTQFKDAHRVLLDQHIPPEWTADVLDEHHWLMKRHGQTICRHERPLCQLCYLRDLCPTGQRELPLDDVGCSEDVEDGFDERPLGRVVS